MPSLWSSALNYAAGVLSWSGTPTKVAPGYTFFTPGVAIAAQEMNYLLNQRDTWNISGVTVPGAAWRASINFSPTGYLMTGGNWDPIGNRWLLCGSVSATGLCDLFASQGNGDSDFSIAVSSGLGAGAGVATSAIWDSSHYFISVVNASTHTVTIYRCSPGGAWTSVLSDAGFNYVDAQLTISGSTIFLFTASNTLMAVSTATVGAGGAGGWALNTTGLATNSGSAIRFANNGTTWIAFPINTASPASYMTTTTPATSWVSRSAAFLTHTDLVIDVVWSPSDSLFILTTTNSNILYTYVSADGITWAAQGVGITSVGAPVASAITAAGCFVVLTADVSTGHQVLYSIDAGQTYHLATGTLPHVASPISRSRVLSSATGFLALNNHATAGARFSHVSGLSPSVT